ncbi:MAG: acyl-CoA thioesterase-1, partial [Phenylobacterium sp.]
GGNDILRNLNLEQTKQNLAGMIELTQSKGIPLVLVGVPNKSLFSDTAPLYQELAEKYQLVFADELVSDLLRTPAFKSDMVHFNQQGYEQMATRLHQLLIERGAL